MRVRFWGTRGSIAKPGPGTLRYGGNTACVEVRSAAGTLVILDGGTGLHGLGQALLAEGGAGRPLHGHLLLSHTHWDHIQGIPFFAPLFAPGNEWDVYGPSGLAEGLRDALAGQMRYAYFPVPLEGLGATVRYHDLVEGAFGIGGDVRVTTRYLNHTALALGYRLEADGASMVYASDHEPHSRRLASGKGGIEGQDRRHAEFLAGADLVVHDAQYLAGEYPPKAGWGHATVEYAVAVCRFARAKRLALTHHDPLRSDDELDRVVEKARAGPRGRGPALEVFAAAEGQVLELRADGLAGGGPTRRPAFPTVRPEPPAVREWSLLLGTADAATAEAVAEAVRADGITVLLAPDVGSAVRVFAEQGPSVVLLDRRLPEAGGLEACRAIRAAGTVHAWDVPVVVLARHEDAAAAGAAGVTDWLLEPFSGTHVRTRVRAWLLRVACRWVPAPLPVDEERRLAAVRRLGILDTRPEERFDRLTRLAAALFDAPIVLVSIVDRDRQWLKSGHGLATQETPREASFCAHAILRREIMVVPDALRDPRFADNPLVAGEPRIRFYAGCPLALPSGERVGTLCVIDTRPRRLDAARLRLLEDLAWLVERELAIAKRPGAEP